jgi:ATP-binding cassette subfamily C protein LapB
MLAFLTRLIVIDGGRIIADGPKDEVMAHLSAIADKPKGKSS